MPSSRSITPTQARKSSIVSNSGTMLSAARPSAPTSPTSLSSSASSSMSETPCGLGDDAGADRVRDRRSCGSPRRRGTARVRPPSPRYRRRTARRAGAASAVRCSSSATRASSSSREIFEARRRRGEEFGDGALVHVGVLAQIERGEMEAEDVDGAAQRAQAGRARELRRRWPRASAAMVVEIGAEFGRARVRRARRSAAGARRRHGRARARSWPGANRCRRSRADRARRGASVEVSVERSASAASASLTRHEP